MGLLKGEMVDPGPVYLLSLDTTLFSEYVEWVQEKRKGVRPGSVEHIETKIGTRYKGPHCLVTASVY